MREFIYTNDDCNDVHNQLLDNFISKLQEIIDSDTSEEIYFHDDVSETVDSYISGLSREQCMEIIDDTGNEDQVESELINKSSLDTMIATMAYGCMEAELFSTDVMQYLQDKLNNETIDSGIAKEILKELEEKFNIKEELLQ